MSASKSTGTPIEVFYSYAHEDEKLRDELEKHLTILKRQGVITGWHDRKITAGQKWAGEIDQHLNTARVILLLISADFLASDYCYEVEMTRALERDDRNEARVIPVILRKVDWQGAPFGKLEALPTDAKPITSWSNLDEAFNDVAVASVRRSKNFATPARERQQVVLLSRMSFYRRSGTCPTYETRTSRAGRNCSKNFATR
jgi:hypothetical protein